MHRRVPSLDKLVRLIGSRPSTPLAVIIDRVTEHFVAKRQAASTPPGLTVSEGVAPGLHLPAPFQGVATAEPLRLQSRIENPKCPPIPKFR